VQTVAHERDALNAYPLDLIERDLIRAPVVELGGASAGMIGHAGGFFERAAALEISGNAGSPECLLGRPL